MSPVAATLIAVLTCLLVAATEESTNCTIPADYCFAADLTNSITDGDFITLVDIISHIVDGLNVGPTAQDSRVAMVKYGRDVFREFNLTTYTDKATLVDVISNVARIERTTPGGTNTPGAMEECVRIFEEQGRVDVSRVIVVITDGVTHYFFPTGNNDTFDQLRLEEATAVTVAAGTINYGVAFGSRVMNVIDRATSELLTITGNNSDHVFIAETLDILNNLTTVLTATFACPSIPVRFNPSIYSVKEGMHSSAVITMNTLEYRPPYSFTVTVLAQDGSAIRNSDYVGENFSVTFPAGVNVISFNVTIIDDDIAELAEFCTLVLEIPATATAMGVIKGSPDTATVNIMDDEVVAVSFSPQNCTIPESTPADLMIILEQPSPRDITVTVTTMDITAEAPGDYVGGSFDVVIPTGTVQVTVSVDTVQDFTIEPDEYFSATLSLPGAQEAVAVSSPDVAFVTITDNTPTVPVQFNPADYSVTEGLDNYAVISLEALADHPDVDFTVTVMTQNGSAIREFDNTGDSDYVGEIFMVTFPAGMNVISFNVSIIDDGIAELDEFFTIILEIPAATAAMGVIKGSADTATVNIMDDEVVAISFCPQSYTVHDSTPADLTIVLDQPSPKDATVTITTMDITAEAPGDYVGGSFDVVIPTGTVQVTVSVDTVQDFIIEPDEYFSATLSLPGAQEAVAVGSPDVAFVTITENTSVIPVRFNPSNQRRTLCSDYTVTEGVDSNAVITLEALADHPDFNFTVTVLTRDGSANRGSDYVGERFSVTFPAGVNVISFNVSIFDDDIAELAESFTLVLEIPAASTAMGVIKGSPNSLTVNIIDDEVVAVSFSPQNYTVPEGTPVDLMIVLDKPSLMSIIITVTTMDEIAEDPDDYVGGSFDVTIPAGAVLATVAVNSTQDIFVEPDEYFSATLSLPGAQEAVAVGSPDVAFVTIIDITPPVPVRFNPSNYTVTEGVDSNAVITLEALAGHLSFIFTVNVLTQIGSAIRDSDYEGESFSVTFPAGVNVVSFNVTIIDDDIAELAEFFTLVLEIPAASTAMGVIKGSPDSTIVNIMDEEVVAVSFSPQDYTVHEGTPANLTIVMDKPSPKDIAVTVTTMNNTAHYPADYVGGSFDVVIPTGTVQVTVYVNTTQDIFVEPDEYFSATLSLPGAQEAVAVGSPDVAFVTITDNTPPVPVQFNPADYTVMEGVDSNAVISLEALADHPDFNFTVTVLTQGGNANRNSDYVGENVSVTFPAGMNVMSFNVTIIDDDIAKLVEYFILVLEIPAAAAAMGVIKGSPDTATVSIMNDEELTNCTIPVDYCIAADSSNSIMGEDFITLVDIVAAIVDGLNVGPTAQDSRVAMVKYGRDVFREFNLTTYTDKATLVDVISNVARIERTTPGGTNTPGAMEECVRIFEEQGRVDVSRVIVVITDGVTHYFFPTGNNDTFDQLRLEEATAVTVAAGTINYGVAFGSRVMNVIDRATSELLTITGNNSDHAFIAEDLAVFTILAQLLTAAIACPSIPMRFNSSTYTVTEGVGNNAAITLEALEHHPSYNFTVTVLTRNGSAIRDSDYVGEYFSVTFPAGVNVISFNVTIIDDNIAELAESFTLILEIPAAATAMGVIKGSPDTATVNILDDEVCIFNGTVYNVAENVSCPSCPAGQKMTASTPPGPGVCCPTITCEPIACTIGDVDYVVGDTIPTIDPCEINCTCAVNGNRNCSGMTCPSCLTDQKVTASIPPGPGVCCPTITCEPIACTIGGVDYVAGETIPTLNPCEINCSCAADGSKNCSITTCASCPLGQKVATSIPPGPGVCCPTITCDSIACTIGDVDYVAGETILNTSLPCPPIPVIEQYITRDTATVLKLNSTSVVMNVITGGQVLVLQATASRAKRQASDTTLVNISIEGAKFLYVLGLTPGQEYSLKVATVNDAAVSRFTEWINFTTTNSVVYSTPSDVAGTLLLRWTPPTQFDGNSLSQYEVTLTPLGAGSDVQIRYILKATQSQLTAQNLRVGEEYQVEIETRVDSGLLQPFYSMNITIPTISPATPTTCTMSTIAIASGWVVAGVLLLCMVVTLVVAFICWRRRSGRHSLKLWDNEGIGMVASSTFTDAAYSNEMVARYSSIGEGKTHQPATQESTLEKTFKDEYDEVTMQASMKANPAYTGGVTAEPHTYDTPYICQPVGGAQVEEGGGQEGDSEEDKDRVD